LGFDVARWRLVEVCAIPLFAAFSGPLKETMGLDSVCEDRTVWPGIAAIWADRENPELKAIRARLSEVAPIEMMGAIKKMVQGIVAKHSYLDVLKAGGVE
jgi:hypothetical protein